MRIVWLAVCQEINDILSRTLKDAESSLYPLNKKWDKRFEISFILSIPHRSIDNSYYSTLCCVTLRGFLGFYNKITAFL